MGRVDLLADDGAQLPELIIKALIVRSAFLQVRQHLNIATLREDKPIGMEYRAAVKAADFASIFPVSTLCNSTVRFKDQV
ncbi:hypothetical protein [Rugamonas rivuli]|uniref:Uncharacterized protein n=1 Tax=Rugamonas rivuli TaxID=2743358 RepID=A0A843S9K3_9BURK|nr:hypothetical protein [Rugamonas rivuli]MQA21155.1 hypothetical protein [Rugamonas rivuli]